METQKEKTKSQDTVLVPGLRTSDNLGRPIVKPDTPKRVKTDENKYLITYGVRPKKDDPTRSEVYVEKREDIQKMIQVNADKVGIKAMLKAVALGEISAASLADDGTGSVDDRRFTGFVPPLQALAKESSKTIEEAKKQFGDLDSSNFESIIKKAVDDRIAQIQAEKAAKKEGE